MTFAGLVVAALIAVGGWLVNAHAARTAVRRQQTIDYLLAAYRRLDDASNRKLTREHDAAIEQAIADVMLLGSVREVELAEQFATEFATSHSAGTGPLLEELRASLRRQLHLEPVPARKFWLRMESNDEWDMQSAAIRKDVTPAPPSEVHAMEHDLPHDTTEARDRVLAAHDVLARDLRERLERVEPGQFASVTDDDLGGAAKQHRRLSELNARAFEGLTVMRRLAETGRRPISDDDAREYLALASGVRYAIEGDPLLGTRAPPK